MPTPTKKANMGETRKTGWFTRDSITSVPRFRDIKSWVFDQTGRIGSDGGNGNVTRGSWDDGSTDSVTGIPKMPPNAKYARV